MVTFMKDRLYIKYYIRKPIFVMKFISYLGFVHQNRGLVSNLFKIVSRVHILTQNTYSMKFWAFGKKIWTYCTEIL